MSDLKFAYLAGVLDSDGWFSIQKTKRKESTYSMTFSPVLGVANTSYTLMNWLTSNFGGKLRKRKPNGWMMGKKIRWQWSIPITTLRMLLPEIIPLLVIKKRQAELLLELANSSNTKYRGVGIPDKVQKKRIEIYNQIRSLNK